MIVFWLITLLFLPFFLTVFPTFTSFLAAKAHRLGRRSAVVTVDEAYKIRSYLRGIIGVSGIFPLLLVSCRGLICFLHHHSCIPISPSPLPPHLLFSILQAHFFITIYIIIFLVFSLHFYYMIFFGNKIIKFMFIFFFSPFPFFAILLLNEKGKVKEYTPNERKIRVEKV